MKRVELAKKLKVTEKTIFEWQKNGLPCKKQYHQGLRWRWDFDFNEVKLWLEDIKSGSKTNG